MCEHIVQDSPTDRVIIYDQYGEIVQIHFLYAQRCRQCCTLDCKPSGKVECASLTHHTLHPQLAPHQLYEMRSDGQPQAGTAMFPCRGSVSLGKRLKN